MQEGRIDYVGLNLEIFADKIGRLFIVRLDTTYPGCRQVDPINVLVGEKVFDL